MNAPLREERTLAWGVDVGGTDCKVGIVDEKGHVHAELEFETPPAPADAARSIGEACEKLADRLSVSIDRLGIGVPGPLRLDEGIIVYAPNLGWGTVPLRDMIEAEVGCSVTMDNDANAAAYGEAWVGAGRGADVLLLVTLGTGVGGGVVGGGRVYHGARGQAVEVGHQVVVPAGRECSCGKRGCVEAYFSAHALSEQAGIVPGSRDHRELFSKYAAGDERVARWLETAIDILAHGVANASALFDPDRIVFTGGLTGSWEVFSERLVSGILYGMGPAALPPEMIRLSELRGQAGVIGAAGLALHGRDGVLPG